MYIHVHTCTGIFTSTITIFRIDLIYQCNPSPGTNTPSTIKKRYSYLYIVCKHIHVHVYAHIQFHEYKFNYHVTVNYEVKTYLIRKFSYSSCNLRIPVRS